MKHLQAGDNTLSVKPLVSVNMITYNHELYIAQAIEGVINQKTNFPFELVIGEDCSTDNTRKKIYDYQMKYPDIIKLVTSDSNVGGHQNSLRTTKACTGKYMAYCEGDDYWHNQNKLQIQVDFLEANPDYGIVHGNANKHYVDTDVLEKNVYDVSPLYDDENAYFDIIAGRRKVTTLTVCLRKKLLDEVIECNPECQGLHFLMGDYQLWMEFSRISKVKFINESLATYNVLSESMSRSQDPIKSLKFALSVRDLFYHYLNKYDCPIEIANQVKALRTNGALKAAIWARNKDISKEMMITLLDLHAKPTLNYKERISYFGIQNKNFGYLLDKLRYMYSLINKRGRL